MYIRLLNKYICLLSFKEEQAKKLPGPVKFIFMELIGNKNTNKITALWGNNEGNINNTAIINTVNSWGPTYSKMIREEL